MTQVSSQHLEGFFHGMAHSIHVANQNKRGFTSRQVRALEKEYATLKLLNERKASGQISTPSVNPAPVSCSPLEAITGALIVSMPFWATWGYYLITGNHMVFS